MMECALEEQGRATTEGLFTGKAHSRDGEGKQLLMQIGRLQRDPSFAGRVVFVEDYGINVGRHLVQGVDVWLNTPRRPAS